jgi:hypothetical protein
MTSSPQHGVLILAYTYPPRGGVGGLRALRVAEAFVARGWRVFALTAAGGRSLLRGDTAPARKPDVDVAPLRSRLHPGSPMFSIDARTPGRDTAPVAVHSSPRRVKRYGRLTRALAASGGSL